MVRMDEERNIEESKHSEQGIASYIKERIDSNGGCFNEVEIECMLKGSKRADITVNFFRGELKSVGEIKINDNEENGHREAKKQIDERGYVEKTKSHFYFTIVVPEIFRGIPHNEIFDKKGASIRLYNVPFEDKNLSNCSINDIVIFLHESAIRFLDRKQRLSPKYLYNISNKLLSTVINPTSECNKLIVIDVAMKITRKILQDKHNDFETVESLDDIEEIFRNDATINYFCDELVDLRSVDRLINILLDTNNLLYRGRKMKMMKFESMKNSFYNEIFNEEDKKEISKKKEYGVFYTLPQSAQLLAGLAITDPDATVIDPGHGAGAMLLASYNRKVELAQPRTRAELKRLYNKFFSEDIVGNDILKESCIITQNFIDDNNPQPGEKCKSRILNYNALDLPEYIEKECELDRYNIFKDVVSTKEIYTYDNNKIILKKFDVVIMNPPFTRRREMSKDFRNQIDNKKYEYFTKKCGKNSLWTVFLALSDELVEDNGIIATVLPISFLQMNSKIVKYIIDNYYIKYIVLPAKGTLFTVSAGIDNFLLVIQKKKPKDTDETMIVNLQDDIQNMNSGDICKLVKSIHNKDPKIDFHTITHKEISNEIMGYHCLLPYTIKSSKILCELQNEICSKEIIKSLGSLNYMAHDNHDGDGVGMEEIKNILRITYPNTHVSEKCPNKYISHTDKYILFENGNKKHQINMEDVIPTLWRGQCALYPDLMRSPAFIIINTEGLHEIMNGYDEKILKEKILKYRQIFDKCPVNIIFGSNFDILEYTYASVCSSVDFINISNYGFNIPDDEERKILCVYLNSIPVIARLVQSVYGLGAWKNYHSNKIKSTPVIDPKALTKDQKEKILTLFDELNSERLPTIADQLKTRNKTRIKLDTEILRILGFTDEYISEKLEKIYDEVIRIGKYKE